MFNSNDGCELLSREDKMLSKQRGKKRKLQSLLNNIDGFVPFLETDEKYEHFHVPCSRSFIDGAKTRTKLKAQFLKKWLETTEKFIEISKTKSLPFCKIVAVTIEDDYWGSQIIIFYSKEYYDNFFKRNDEYQTWTEVDNRRSFIKQHGVTTSLTERCIMETLIDDDYEENSFMWIYA